MKSLFLISLAIVGTLMTGCDYQRGYTDGKNSGYNEGYHEGHRVGYQKGFVQATEKTFPGNGSTHAAWLQWLNAFLAVACCAKIIVSICAAIIFLTFESASHHHTAGKALMGTLGGLFAFWFANTLELFSAGTIRSGAKAFFLAPAPESMFGHAAQALVALIPALLVCIYFDRIFRRPERHPWRAGMHVFVLTMLLAIIIPVFFSCFDTPDIARYRAFDLTVGWLIGTIVYIAARFMSHKPDGIADAETKPDRATRTKKRNA